MGYVFASFSDVIEGKISKYNESLRMVREAARNKTGEMFTVTFGGLTPTSDQFAEVSPRPEMFDGIGGSALSNSFRQDLDATGWNSILTADLSNSGNVGSDWVLGVAGIAYLDSAKRVPQLYMSKGDYTHPILDIEEMYKEDGVVMIFDMSESDSENFVFDKNNSFTLNADIVATGYQRIKPLGVAHLPKDKAIAETY